MSKQAGHLLLNRMQITIAADSTVEVETGLEQQNLNLYPDPPLGGVEPSGGDPDGTASRVIVCMMAPTAGWENVTHEEPFLHADGTIHVMMSRGAGEALETLNVLFWDPHTSVCPMDAVTYNPPIG